MPGTIIIDINRRTISKRTLLWNRLTPTRGARTVSRAIAERASGKDLMLDIEGAAFGHFTRGLSAAGVTKILVMRDTPAKEIRKALNFLTDRGFHNASRLLPRHGFDPESSAPELRWAELRSSLVPVDYREGNYFSWEQMLVGGFLGFGLGGCLLDLQPASVKFGSALFGAICPPLFKISSRLIKHLSRAVHFYEDCRLLDQLSRVGKTSDLKRLRSIVWRLTPGQLKPLTRQWDLKMLAWLLSFNKDLVMNDPRVSRSLKTARFSTDADELAALASSPIPLIRAAAAKNPDTPETVLGKLINEDADPEVREAVQKNPLVITMLQLAAASTKPEELDDLARKPFPCVRRAAARNPKTPAEAVAYVLSQLQKDPIEGVVATDSTNYAGPCDTPDFQITEIMGIIGYGYVGKSLEISREILKPHAADKLAIMQRLQELNAELYQALNS